MDEQAVFVKLDKSKKINQKMYSVKANMRLAANLLLKIEKLRENEQDLVKKWEKRVKLASRNLEEVEERLPKGKL